MLDANDRLPICIVARFSYSDLELPIFWVLFQNTYYFVALLERTIRDCTDVSLRTALKSLHLDLMNKKGWLVPLFVKPRLCARKDIFVIGGSRRELNTVSLRGPDFNYVAPERYDTRKKYLFSTICV